MFTTRSILLNLFTLYLNTFPLQGRQFRDNQTPIVIIVPQKMNLK